MFWSDIFLSLRSVSDEAIPKRSSLLYPRKKYIWSRVRILHETDKAILVDNGMKIWIPKSRIHRIRLRNNIFEIYVRESAVG